MSLVPLRATSRWKEWSPMPRWKEWLPLATQQHRLRSIMQIAAYNVPWRPGSSLYFTLHETTMSPPFYTSERLQHQHPSWGEIEISGLPSAINTSATGVVIRLWLHQGSNSYDQVVLVWGVYFSGLVYLGPRLTSNASQFNENTVVLHMNGGYFTDRLSLIDLPPNALVRNVAIMLPLADTRPSYSVALLLRLRNIQQAIKKLSVQSSVLRQKILEGGMSGEEVKFSRETNPTLRKLLNRDRPKPQQRQETLSALCQVEVLRCRVALLRQERLRKLAQVDNLEKQHDLAANENADLSCDLTGRYQNLHKEIEHLREKRRHFTEMREVFLQKSTKLSIRRKQLLTQLSLIYPVQLTNGKYTICGIHLPNSEELSNADDTSVSVALGFVAHLVQMVSIFLQVPLRYPIIHFGSRSKIIDHIAEKIPDKEREFPLFARGKDKLQFHYGVYLLNKNIAQLRWLVGFPTNDLRATLHNVYHLLHLNQFSTLENHHRSMSGSSLDVISSSVNVSPVGSVVSALGLSHCIAGSPNQFRARHRSSNSIGSSELLYTSGKRSGSSLSPSLSHHTSTDGLAGSTNLSYSLDKGLDEYEGTKRTEDSSSPLSSTTTPSNLAHVGSEPNLVMHSHTKSLNGIEHPITVIQPTPEINCVKHWKGEGSIPLSSGDESCLAPPNISTKSEFTLVTESIVKLVDYSKSFDTDAVPSACENSSQGNSICEELRSREVVDVSKTARCEDGTTDVSDKMPCDITPSQKVLFDKIVYDDGTAKQSFVSNDKSDQNAKDLKKVASDIEVDVGTDALADISNGKSSNFNGSSNSQHATCDLQEDIPSGNQKNCDNVQESDHNGMECVGVEESVLVDNLFASVTSRTEALASHTTSFNLMSSRHGST